MARKITQNLILGAGLFLLAYMLLFFAWEVTKLHTWSGSGRVDTDFESPDSTHWVFSEVDSSEFVGLRIPAVGDTILSVSDSISSYAGIDSLLNRIQEPGAQYRISFSRFGRERVTALVAQPVTAGDIVPFVILGLLRFVIILTFLGVGLWAFVKRGEAGSVRAFTLFSYSMVALLLISMNVFGESYAQFNMPLREQISYLLRFFSLFIGGFWLTLHLLFPRTSSFIKRFRIRGYVAVFSPQIVIVILVLLNQFQWVYGLVTMTAQFAIGFYLLARHLRRSRSVLERRQMRLVLYGSAIGLSAFLAMLLIGSFWTSWFSGLELTTQLIYINAMLLLLLATPFSYAYAFGKYRLLEVEGKLRRGTRHLLVTAALVLVFFALVYGISELLLRNMGITSRTPTLFVAIVLSLGISPAQRWLQELIERRFNPERHQLRVMIEDFSQRMGSFADREMLWEQLAIRLREAIGVEHVTVVLRRADGSFIEQDGTVTPFTIESELVRHIERTSRPVPLDEAMASLRIPFSDGQIMWVNRWRIHLFLPLFARGRLIGLLGLGRTTRGRDYTPEDISVLANLTHPLALATENLRLLEENIEKRRLEEQLQMARDIQQGFLPTSLPVTPGLDIAATSRFSLEVAGDYYDVIALQEGKTLFAVGDVSGKGAGAAMIMANLQASLRTAVRAGVSLADVVAGINDLICHNTPMEQYITFFVGIYDPENGELLYVNAGHNPPLIFSADGSVRELSAGGLILGAIPGASYEMGRSQLRPRDRLLLYTDGASEAMNARGEEFGEERLMAVVRKAELNGSEALVEGLVGEVLRFRGNRDLEDDLTLLVACVSSEGLVES